MILANGCDITKSEKFKGVWILSVPTVYIYIYIYICVNIYVNIYILHEKKLKKICSRKVMLWQLAAYIPWLKSNFHEKMCIQSKKTSLKLQLQVHFTSWFWRQSILISRRSKQASTYQLRNLQQGWKNEQFHTEIRSVKPRWKCHWQTRKTISIIRSPEDWRS